MDSSAFFHHGSERLQGRARAEFNAYRRAVRAALGEAREAVPKLPADA